MNTLQRCLACLAFPLLAGAAPPARAPAATPVAMASRPGTALDAAARALAAQDLQEAAQAGERPLLLVGTARLSASAERLALFVQLQSPRECGSAGCNTAVYVWGAGRYQRVLDGAPGRITVAATQHRGMADLLVGEEQYVWTGTAYADSRPAPNVDLRPRRRRPAH